MESSINTIRQWYVEQIRDGKWVVINNTDKIYHGPYDSGIVAQIKAEELNAEEHGVNY